MPRQPGDGLSLSGPDWEVVASSETCLGATANYASYYSLLETDPMGQPVLLLGTRWSNVKDHHRIITLDSELNIEYEEFISNNYGYTFNMEWEDVAFDPSGTCS